MAQNNALPDVYPLATLDGTQINYDIARPNLVTAVAALTATEAQYTVLDVTRLFMFYTLDDVQILFEPVGTGLGAKRGFVLGRGERALVAIPTDVATLYIKALVADCAVYVHELDSWHGLTTPEATQIG